MIKDGLWENLCKKVNKHNLQLKWFLSVHLQWLNATIKRYFYNYSTMIKRWNDKTKDKTLCFLYNETNDETI